MVKKSKNKTGGRYWLFFVVLLFLVLVVSSTYFSVSVASNQTESCIMPFSNSSFNECEIFLTLPEGEAISSYTVTLSDELVTGPVSSYDLVPFDSGSFLEVDHSSSGSQDRDYFYLNVYRLPVDNVFSYDLSCSSTFDIREDRDERGVATAGVRTGHFFDYSDDSLIVCKNSDSSLCDPDKLVWVYDYVEYGKTSTNVRLYGVVDGFTQESTSQNALRVRGTVSSSSGSVNVYDEDDVLLISNGYLRTDVGTSSGTVSFPSCSVDVTPYQEFDTLDVYLGSKFIQSVDFSSSDKVESVDLADEINSYCGRDNLNSLECNVPLIFKSSSGGEVVLKSNKASLSPAVDTIACVGCDGSQYSFKGSVCPSLDCSVTCYKCVNGEVDSFIHDSFKCPSGSTKIVPDTCLDTRDNYTEYQYNTLDYTFIFLIVLGVVLVVFIVFNVVKLLRGKKK